MSRCDSEGATHHTGCECHEARRDAEIERLKVKLDEVQHKVGQLRGLLRLVWEDACEQEAGFLDEVCDAVEKVFAEES